MISVLESGFPPKRQKIDFEKLIDGLAQRNVVFLSDVHTSFGPYASNQRSVIDALKQRWKDELVIGMEYAGKSEVQKQHLPLLETGMIQYLGIRGIDEKILSGEIDAFSAYRKMDENCIRLIKENISNSKRIAVIFGKQHLHHENGIPFKLNGSSQVSVVYQDSGEGKEEGIFRVLKSSLSGIYRGKQLYEIIGKLS